jgi:MtfA peptidase
VWPFGAIRAARRRRILENEPIDEGLWAWAVGEHPIFAGLGQADLAELRSLATIFLGEKAMYYAEGLEEDPRLLVSVAAQACLPILRPGSDWYDDWETIYLVPEEFLTHLREVDASGVAYEYDDELAGQVMELGPIVLSAKDVDASGWGEGYNVVIHELAHKLDDRNGSLDGMPPLPGGVTERDWDAAFGPAYESLRAKTARPGRKRKGTLADIDEYGAESPSEFFAVSCEYFFERPRLLKARYPEVYALLSAFFRQDPAQRL